MYPPSGWSSQLTPEQLAQLQQQMASQTTTDPRLATQTAQIQPGYPQSLLADPSLVPGGGITGGIYGGTSPTATQVSGGDWFTQNAPTSTPSTNATAPTTTTSTNPMDRNYIIQQLTQQLAAMGLQPGPRGSGVTDVQYYADQILNTGGWQGGNAGYWTNRLQQDARGGSGATGAAGSFMTGRGTQEYAPFQMGAPCKLPTLEELRNTPGYQFALQAESDAINRSAAAKGTLLTGGTLKGLAQ